MKFQYVTIAVSNLERSKEFYSELFGISPSQSFERWVGYSLEHNAGFGIIEDKNMGTRGAPDIINFIVSDFGALWQRIHTNVDVVTPPATMPWGTRKFVIKDPDGFKIGFLES